MSQKIIISLLVCAVAIPVVVHSAPNRNTAEVAPHRTEEEVLAVTNLSSSTVRPSNELEHSDEGSDLQENAPSSRTKRAIIFRPLFVYRQQEIKKQKLREMREQQQQQPQREQSAACAACQQQQQQQQQQQTPRKPVRYYAQNYPYQRL
uniref:probable global transcription activator SNF2L2 n=1 Tax=Anopheles coluzzii TaxID=1518534 RepID=UPI0020FF9096|nr:probable global transcription activator SNF2L2 [Anopheles coluzzii]